MKAYEKAIEIYNDTGRFAMSARYYKELAELLEAEREFDLALEKYQVLMLFSPKQPTYDVIYFNE